jgi:Protein of unknown function (DUF551)
MSWQPIETAPKDKSWVLLSGGQIGYGWYEQEFPPAVVAQYAGKSWQFAWYDSGFYGEYLDPTHWMPLPEPPKP